MSMERSLYERLGGTEGITKIAENVIERHMVNPGIKARFLPLKDDPEHFAVISQHLINFFVTGSGGPEVYTGKDMVSAHRGMNISSGEYMDAIDDIMGALDHFNIDEQSQKDVLAIVYSLKVQMVNL